MKLLRLHLTTPIRLHLLALLLLVNLTIIAEGRADEPLTRTQAVSLLDAEWTKLKTAQRAERLAAIKTQIVTVGEHQMRYHVTRFGKEPEAGHSLWISMHGGGGAAKSVNDGQWHNQARLYKLKEGYYISPRAPTDTWNLWHQKHIDPLFDKLIADYVIAKGVDPNRIYIMGYSAGGDGVYQLAPRFADRLAAAAMMAGHPNETKPDGLRNIGFALYMGGRDGGYKRNEHAARWKKLLGNLHKDDPDGYRHQVKIFPQHAHWMNGDDRAALPWLADFSRKPWPKKVVWLQDDVTHNRFYWLAVENPKKGMRITASVDKQTISLRSDNLNAVTLRLHDDLINLDQAIRVVANGKEVFKGGLQRTKNATIRSLHERSDPATACFATLTVQWE